MRGNTRFHHSDSSLVPPVAGKSLLHSYFDEFMDTIDYPSFVAQNAAAAAATIGVVPAAADEVSAVTAAQFAAHAQMYQAVSAQAAAVHVLFATTLKVGAGAYAAAEAANAAASS
jgi:hypothetical protein